MKLPEKLRIGYKTYKVEDWDRKEAASRNRLGEHDSVEAVIRVDTDVPIQEIFNTLIHEIFHACYQMGDLERESSEEKVVTVMSNQFTQVLQDNPDLIRFIKEAT